MEWLIGCLMLIGMLTSAAAGFFAGRLFTAPDEPPAPAAAPPLTEAEKRKQRELQNFLQYDGFTQP
ncbi:MAG: hypothetical protein IKI63_03640 [Clostridia bacterium]|nr:hypothetical protein [Clostridia bacterium]